MRGRAISAAARRFTPICAAAVLCTLLANCSSGVDSRYGVSASPRVVSRWRAGAEGRRRLSRRRTLYGRRPDLCPGREPALPRRGSRVLVRRRFPWPLDRQRRNFRPQRHLRRASDVAAAELCAGDQSLQRPLADRARQRSRAVSRQPDDRPVDEGGAAAWLPQCGTARVRVEYVGRAPMEGSDDRMLEATLRQDGPAPAPGGVRLAAAPAHSGRVSQTAGSDPPRFASAAFASARRRRKPGCTRRADDVVCAATGRHRRYRSDPQRPRPLLTRFSRSAVAARGYGAVS